MKTEIIKATKKGRLLKYTYTSGVNIGDYNYVLLDSEGNFVERIGNRTNLQPYLDSL